MQKLVHTFNPITIQEDKAYNSIQSDVNGNYKLLQERKKKCRIILNNLYL